MSNNIDARDPRPRVKTFLNRLSEDVSLGNEEGAFSSVFKTEILRHVGGNRLRKENPRIKVHFSRPRGKRYIVAKVLKDGFVNSPDRRMRKSFSLIVRRVAASKYLMKLIRGLKFPGGRLALLRRFLNGTYPGCSVDVYTGERGATQHFNQNWNMVLGAYHPPQPFSTEYSEDYAPRSRKGKYFCSFKRAADIAGGLQAVLAVLSRRELPTISNVQRPLGVHPSVPDEPKAVLNLFENFKTGLAWTTIGVATLYIHGAFLSRGF